MSIPVSTIPQVKAYFYAQLKARSELTSGAAGARQVLVSYDVLTPNVPDEYVMVGNVRRQVSVARMVGGGGAGWLDERYELDITTSVYRGGDEAQTVFERACAIADVVVDVVRLDPSLGGLVIQCNPLQAEYRSDWADNNAGRETQVIQPFEVFATI